MFFCKKVQPIKKKKEFYSVAELKNIQKVTILLEFEDSTKFYTEVYGNFYSYVDGSNIIRTVVMPVKKEVQSFLHYLPDSRYFIDDFKNIKEAVYNKKVVKTTIGDVEEYLELCDVWYEK